MRGWLRLAGVVLLPAAAVVAVQVAVLDVVAVTSESMRPTLCAGDRLLVMRLGAGEAAETGDLVTFHDPAEQEPTVKRVVAVGGQTVRIRDAVLVVDGTPVREPYVDRRTVDGTYFGPVNVPDGTVFLLGDERERSIDSRDYGPVDRAAVDGRVLGRLPGTYGHDC